MTKIIVAGKGGAGKSTFISILTLGILKANPDKKILLIDADPSANVLLNFGIDTRPNMSVGEIEIFDGDPDKDGKVMDLFEKGCKVTHTISGKDIDYAFMGHHERNSCLCGYNNLLNDLLKLIEKQNKYDYILVDREAGVEHINRSVYSGDNNFMFILTWPTQEYLTVAKDIIDLTEVLGSTGNKILVLNNFINIDLTQEKVSKIQNTYFPYIKSLLVMPHMQENTDFMKRPSAMEIYDSSEEVQLFIKKCIELIESK